MGLFSFSSFIIPLFHLHVPAVADILIVLWITRIYPKIDRSFDLMNEVECQSNPLGRGKKELMTSTHKFCFSKTLPHLLYFPPSLLLSEVTHLINLLKVIAGLS